MCLCFQLIFFRFAKQVVTFRARKDRCLKFCTFLNDIQRMQSISLTMSFKDITCNFDNMFHKFLAVFALISLYTFFLYIPQGLYTFLWHYMTCNVVLYSVALGGDCVGGTRSRYTLYNTMFFISYWQMKSFYLMRPIEYAPFTRIF